ncbi:probable inactive receptor kinase At5g58300 [Triticum dicoccoides]|uniref:probable inactive receptor kinase At5g58300 n=1 Tax=Triticum dicoccoides TaxID=85692 RepID=UPI000E7B40DA|nr:probable inactive receptor kinase At5g58300 [Triticum dicoccoides]XP_037419204.1 probable inactive receptor kinase At5g58300 [Triticum dicoccoides]
MQHLLLIAFLSASLFLPYPPCAKGADLNSDKQALLAFASSLPHARKINWTLTTQVCTSWVGVTCTPDGKRVRMLRLPAVGLFGPMPSNILGKLDALEVLSLRSNRLTVSLPPDVASIPSLHSLYLQRNNLSGIIPTSLSSNLAYLDLSYNTFVGEIPLKVQNMTELTGLSLQNNSLSGPIPDLHLPKLRYLNLSYNNLSGPIPASLQKYPASSFLGNAFLCGFPLEPCPGTTPSPSPNAPPSQESNLEKFWGKHHKIIIIAILAGGAAILLILIIILVICICKRKRDGEPRTASSSSKGKGVAGGRGDKSKPEYSSGVQEAERNKLVFFEGCSYNFDLEDLLRASAEVLGKGSYGTTYKAVLEDGTTVVVKRLKEVVAGKKEFEQQMEIIDRLGQHQGVVPLRAFYYSKDEKLLVYDYVTPGSLSAALHGNKSAGRAPLDWETRVKISLGAARAIAHLHTGAGGKFIHGNIKSNNIILSRELSACASDFGLAQLMATPHFHPRLVGYRAPEVLEAKKPTQKSDVYSFGVLLLEMLTGKAPLRSPGRDDSIEHLPRWVQSVVREEWTSEVFDVDLQRHPNTEDEMVQLLQVAMACVAVHPDQRPRMEQVVRRIEEIRSSGSGTTTRTSPEDKPREEHIQIT